MLFKPKTDKPSPIIDLEPDICTNCGKAITATQKYSAAELVEKSVNNFNAKLSNTSVCPQCGYKFRAVGREIQEDSTAKIEEIKRIVVDYTRPMRLSMFTTTKWGSCKPALSRPKK